MDRHDHLKRFPFLAGLPAAALVDAAARCAWRRCDPGQMILGHNDASDDVLLIVDGALRVTVYSKGGRQVTFRDYGAREIVAWHDADPRRRRVDPAFDALVDRMIGDQLRARPPRS